MKILLIEDDEAQARALQQLLIRSDPPSIDVQRVASLTDARERLADTHFDAILLDLTLPDSSGLETIRGVNEVSAAVPVIVFSALDDEPLAQQAVAEGAQDYLVKGQVGVRDLVRSVRYSIERHRAQAAARESEERFRLLVDAVEEYAIIMLDPDGRVVSWNAGAERIKHYTADEAIGQHVSLFYMEEDRARGVPQEHLRLATTQGTHRAQGWRVRKDQSRFHAEVTITALRDRSGRLRGFSKITRDTTEQKRIADELHAYQERLRRLTAELNRNEDAERRRLASLLHDGISQALAAAQIKLDMIPQVAGGECGETLRDVRDMIREAIELTRTMTLDLSPPVLYQVGLPAALVSLSEQVRRRHGLAMEVCCRGVWNPMMNPETRGLLYQAIRELVNNVIKHARAARVQVLLMRRNPGPDGTPGSVHVRVIDDGIGFDASALESPEGRKEGFGLFNLRERLAQAQGSLAIHSAPGGGTEVELEVPFELYVREPAHAGAG